MTHRVQIPTLEEFNHQLESWSPKLLQPLWYKELMPVILRFWRHWQKNEQTEALKSRLYNFFAEKLDKGEIALAEKGPDFDAGRQPVNRVIIYYTSRQPGITVSTLSAIGLLRLYAADYSTYNDVWGQDITGQSIWSGHFLQGRQVFFPYHWLVRMDGQRERLLEDDYVGWHAGDGEINRRSIAIALDGDFENSEPPEEAVKGIAEIIQNNYPQIKKEEVSGHLEVNPSSKAPGSLFLPVWKEKLLALLP